VARTLVSLLHFSNVRHTGMPGISDRVIHRKFTRLYTVFVIAVRLHTRAAEECKRPKGFSAWNRRGENARGAGTLESIRIQWSN